MGQSNILQAFQFNFSLFLVVSCGGRFFFCACVFPSVRLFCSFHLTKKKPSSPKMQYIIFHCHPHIKQTNPKGNLLTVNTLKYLFIYLSVLLFNSYPIGVFQI